MLQAIIKDGRVLAKEVPSPVVSKGSVLIRVIYSCISAGTEISGIQSSEKTSLIRKAMKQPEKVEKAWNMFKSEGFMKTVVKVKTFAETERKSAGVPRPTGYSLSGVVLAAGEGVIDLKPGDKVAAAGAGIANHAEFVDVPRNLVMRLPEGLDYKTASTVTLGGIAMQGVRRAQIQLGEFVVIYGTGILGLIALQLVKAAGGRCIAVDIDSRRLKLAKDFGAEMTINSSETNDPVAAVSHFTSGHGADTVIFTAATTKSLALTQAFEMTRKKGRLVMVGVYGRELRRDDIYQKEIDFLISTSYGPGRYDETYEQKGMDYPYAYVRWTENRNMVEYLRLLANGAVDVAAMIEGVFPLNDVANAFEALSKPERPLMVLLNYGKTQNEDAEGYKSSTLEIKRPNAINSNDRIRVGIIGAGNFATGMHLPNLKKLADKYDIRAICNRTGQKAADIAERFGAAYATADYKKVLEDPEIDLTMICTRHNLHGQMVMESLKAGKHTFVEKPLCTTQAELDHIKDFYDNNPQSALPLLMVGFNRRFSKYAREIKKHVMNRVNPLFIHYRMNAGYSPMDSWVHTEEGGGRIIGEACHIIDLFSYLIDSPVRAFSSASLHPKTDSISSSDNKSIILEYEDGSVATLEYFAVGSSKIPKEYMEVHFDEKSIIVDDYKSIRGYSVDTANIKTKRQDKGQLEELIDLYECLKKRTDGWPIPIESMFETTMITLEKAKR
uniref:Bi-domain-containing oxidoreductase n=1 Tax=Candidatus Desulfatibia profunda TaxID=2841695 RepID=A0A8J6NRC8_9BACT|nr:bi-domain-containing oxidoreductase [Candidatus Desulfatibia profunda]